MQQVRKPKPADRSRMTAGKLARNRRSAEQMLVELRQRLREINDLNAAGDVLNWDQATYMPTRGAGSHGRQRAMLYGLAHERAVAPALGTLIDALAHHGESLPYDSDDASLIRVARCEYQKKIKIPRDHVARATAHGQAMRRRDLIKGIAGSAAAWPLAAHAQQPRMPVIGWLFGVSAEAGKPTLAAFRKALADAGYVEGRNVQLEYRWADGKYDRLPVMAADLVGRRVALIVTGGGEPAAFAAKAATSTIPIVMIVGGDPVKEGLVVRLNRPGGNATGATVFSYDMESKRSACCTRQSLSPKSLPYWSIQLTPLWNCKNVTCRKVRRALASKCSFSMPAV
jgi:ABC transporter substrate binding protein/carboxypeptidase Taq (M32) metallopeptidase